ncbi:MAG: tetratricopeptide repeat protein [Pyrinomonadaceae bacterium]
MRTNHTTHLGTIIVAGLMFTASLTYWLDAHSTPPTSTQQEEELFLSSSTARRMSLGFNALVADWYWMRSLQYVGRKILNAREHFELDDLGNLNLKLLSPMLDTATTLDPEFIEAYEYAAIVLPSVNLEEGIRIIRKGIDANPNQWRLYHQLGYIYWQQRDYKMAARIYDRGSSIPGAPEWMKAMKGRLAMEGGSAATAREIYTRLYQESNDNDIRDMARRRLIQLQSDDEIKTIQQSLSIFGARTGRCVNNWSEIAPALHSAGIRLDMTGAPLDPSNTRYILDHDCTVKLAPQSEIPRH